MNTIIIDVRTEKEFSEGSYPGAINISSVNANEAQFAKYKLDHIALVCNSGNRAQKIKWMLAEHGYQNVSLLQHQLNQLNEEPKRTEAIWTIDRQFRMALALLIGLFMLGFFAFNSLVALGILIVVFSGLVYSAITDNCYLKMLIALMPWNKNKASAENSTYKAFEKASSLNPVA
ncbi:MAG: rhodanese-like domain-containing protein [Schleiferiaceae bacterium]|jgi:rhodanese-related sulfurtransferase|nr:rhodanese-like domain-containing protein [Schleiferiaceae bacterium]